MATEVSAKLGLVITAKDEASQIFKDFAAKILENMQSATESVKPLAESFKGMSAAVVGASNTTAAAQKKEREEIFLTRDALLKWARENQEAFKGAGASTNNFADVSTADLKRVYQATKEMKVGVLRDLTAIADITDGPVIAAQNKWRETTVMTSNEIKAALQGIIEKDNTLSHLTQLLGDENSGVWKGMYEQITGVNVALARTVTQENEVAASTRQIAEGFGSMSKASSLQMVGSTIEGLGTKIVGFGIESIKAGAGFEKAVDSIAATLNERLTPSTQLSTDQVDALGKKALELGKSGLYSANELADAMYVMSKQGVDYGNIMGGAIKTVQDVAGATDSSLQDTANVMTDILNEFGPSVTQFGTTSEEQFGKVGDMISGAMHNARMSMTDFLNTLRYVGPLAGGLGLPLTDVSTALSLLAKAGIKGTSSGTMLRAMLADMPGATKPAREEMEKLGIITADGSNKFFDATGKVKNLAQIHDVLTQSLKNLNPEQQEMAMKVMFGMRSLGGMEAIIHTTDEELQTLTGDVTKNGSAHELAAAKMDNTAGRIQILKSNFETLQKTIGITLLPLVESLIANGQKMIDFFEKLPQPVQTVITTVGLLGGTLFLLSGKIMNTVAMYQFFKIAMADLITKVPEAAASTTVLTTATEGATVAAQEAAIATGELNVVTEATVVVDGEAAAAREGLNLANGATVAAAGEAVIATEGLTAATVGAGAAATGASAATGILGGALAFLTSPITLTIAGLAALGVGAVELYKHFTPFHDACDTMSASFVKLGQEVKTAFWGKDYAKDVESMSNKAVASVVTMSNGVLTKLEELHITGGTISKATADDVVNTAKTMSDKIIATAESRYTEEIAAAHKLHDDQKVISEETYKSMIATAENQKKGTIENAQEMNQKVIAEVTAMEKAGIKVTDEMKEKLVTNFKLMTGEAVSVLSEGEVQQRAVLALLQSDHGKVTAQIASQTLKDAATARDGAIKAENDKYKDVTATIIRNRDVLHTLTAAQAQDAIASAETQHKGVLNKITQTYTDTTTELQKERPNLANEMNLTTGAMLTPWQTFEQKLGSILSSMLNGIKNWMASAMASIKAVFGMASTSPAIGAGGTIPAHAQGTSFFQGGPTWVGENGPELVDLPNGAKITPHQSSVNQMIDMGGNAEGKGGNKTQTNNITINISGTGKNGTQLGQDIAKQLRLQMPMVTT